MEAGWTRIIVLAAPALWVYEVTSTFAKAVHIGQITQEEGQLAIHQALTLGVQIIPPDEAQSMLAYQWTLKLKQGAAYDSFYLAIAEALEADFWTADRKLFQSLEGERLSWLHWSGEVGCAGWPVEEPGVGGGRGRQPGLL